MTRHQMATLHHDMNTGSLKLLSLQQMKKKKKKADAGEHMVTRDSQKPFPSLPLHRPEGHADRATLIVTD